MITEVYITQRPGEKARLLHTIKHGSKFKNSPNAKTETAEEQKALAEEQISGWKLNGPWSDATFQIFQDGEEV